MQSKTITKQTVYQSETLQEILVEVCRYSGLFSISSNSNKNNYLGDRHEKDVIFSSFRTYPTRNSSYNFN